MALLATTYIKCRDCYKCIRACPVKAIRIRKDGIEVVEDRCIFEGYCLSICPQGQIQAVSALDKVKDLLQLGTRVIASISPVAVLTFGDLQWLSEALKKLGFSEVRFMAEAEEALIKEYKEVLANSPGPLFSSHCPAICELIEKYFPDFVGRLVPLADQALSHARIIKALNSGECSVVHIGPCLAQRRREDSSLDAVLGIGEVRDWLLDSGIEPPHNQSPLIPIERTNGLFAVSGGLLAAINLKDAAQGGQSISLSGMDDCMRFLRNIPDAIDLQFAELMACPGGCIGGPLLRTEMDMVSRRFQLTQGKKKGLAPPKTYPDLKWEPKPRPFVPPKVSREEIDHALRFHTCQLDCGICGYDHCMNKARAMCEGMAEVEICVPLIRTQGQETLSILEHSPNGVMLVDIDARIRFANPSFYRMFNCEGRNALGRPAEEFMLSDCFTEAIRTGEATIVKKTIPEQGLSFRACIFPITGEALYCAILNDISEEERARQEFSNVKAETLQRAQEVIGRQMKTAQEIAGLLGETTAETKVLLVKLMNLFKEEEPPR